MAYTPYATVSDYESYNLPALTDAEKQLISASRHVDTLTFNRVVAEGFDNLTEFQQEIIKEVVCRLALFEQENADLIESALASYSINGVSMSFGDGAWNVTVEGGVALPKSLYSFLQQTGLCCRVLR